MTRRNLLTVFALSFAALTTAIPARADPVAEWFSVAQQLTGRVPPATDPVAEQTLPLVALAMYDAVVAVEGGYRPWLGSLKAPKGASAEAAAHAAAHAVLSQLYPQDQKWLNGAYDQALGNFADNESRAHGTTVGLEAARRLMKHRGLDAVAATTSYRPVTRAGGFVPPQLPAREWLSAFRPFVLPVRQPQPFRTPGPPQLDSNVYASDYAEVHALGGRQDSRRTPDQTAVAQFWHSADLSQLLPPVFARSDRSLAANARLLAVYATAQFDAGILLSRDKYHHNFWRPVTAIRNADQDGNAATAPDATWEPLLATPSHPDYPCGHCLVSALVATIMADELGQSPPGGIVMVGGTQSAPSTRRYTDFEQMAEEVSDSRVWGGVHFRQGARDGTEMGRKIARYILANAFVPLQPRAASLGR
jgi:hypothetical protein